ncbi:hypothetical protein ACJX0J_036811, partial [Zea mays]
RIKHYWTGKAFHNIHFSLGARSVKDRLKDIGGVSNKREIISVYLEGLWQGVIRKKDMFLERGVFSVIWLMSRTCGSQSPKLSIQHLLFDCHYAKWRNDVVLFRGIYWGGNLNYTNNNCGLHRHLQGLFNESIILVSCIGFGWNEKSSKTMHIMKKNLDMNLFFYKENQCLKLKT